MGKQSPGFHVIQTDVEIRNTSCSEQNVHKVVYILEHCLENQNCFKNFLSGESTDFCVSFVQISEIAWEVETW